MRIGSPPPASPPRPPSTLRARGTCAASDPPPSSTPPTTGWAEDAWTTIALGEVHSDILMPTMRCSMPSRAQPGFDRDRTIGTTIRDQHDNNLGVYAAIALGGTLHVGDTVNTR